MPDQKTDLGTTLLTVKDMAALLSVHPKTISEMTRNGRLPLPLRIGGPTGRPRWRRAEIEAWIAAGTPAVDRWMEMTSKRTA